jgi:hypothetical protein
MSTEFDGVFRFTNATKEDFKVLWNNKEYLFPSETSCPMIIPNESLENIQEIRKKFAYKLALREFHKSKNYTTMSKQGQGLPPLYDDKILEPEIERCLNPLPISKVKVKEMPKASEKQFKGSKAMTDKDNPNFVFKDEPVASLGKMSE